MGNYKSDYDRTCEMYSSVKTDGYSGKQNMVANNTGNYKDPHEHFGYNPKTGESFWHGIGFETRNNKPY